MHEKHSEIIADMAPVAKSEKQEEMHTSQLPSANEAPNLIIPQLAVCSNMNIS